MADHAPNTTRKTALDRSRAEMIARITGAHLPHLRRKADTADAQACAAYMLAVYTALIDHLEDVTADCVDRLPVREGCHFAVSQALWDCLNSTDHTGLSNHLAAAGAQFPFFTATAA